MPSPISKAYAWVWLPGSATPTPAGVLAESDGGTVAFRYGSQYLARLDAVALGPDLPLTSEEFLPGEGMSVASSLRDASPDAWGRQVIDYRRSGVLAASADVGQDSELIYMLHSDSNRFGAIDFQRSPNRYVPRGSKITLEELLDSVGRIDRGDPVPEGIDRALGHGTEMGGARPKATISIKGVEYIAKFSRASDTYDVVGIEAAAMYLAEAAGVTTAATHVLHVGGKKVLMVERFDRGPGGRRMALSGLTVLERSELSARYGTYPDLLRVLQKNGSQPDQYREEVFRRIAVNIAVSNTDDHLRNHAVFWDGTRMDLTPAYDISPMPRSGKTAAQAIGIGDDWKERDSTFGFLHQQRHHYGLSAPRAKEVINGVIDAVEAGWEDAAEAGALTASDARKARAIQILNPGTLHEWKALSVSLGWNGTLSGVQPQAVESPSRQNGKCGAKTANGRSCGNPRGSCPHHGR